MTIEQTISETVRQAINEAMQQQPAAPIELFNDKGIQPMKVYSFQEVANILGITKASVYQIQEIEMPRCRRGAGGGKGVLGINILTFILGLEPVDLKARVNRLRESLQSERSKVLPISEKRTRVI